MRQNRPWPLLLHCSDCSEFMLSMRTCLPCHIPERWSRTANRIWPDLAFGFVHERSGNEIKLLLFSTLQYIELWGDRWRMHGRSPCREGTLRLHPREYFSSTILDKINGTSGPPLPPFQWCQNGAFLAPSRLHRYFAGDGGMPIILSKIAILDKINETSGPPLPPFQWCQNGAFLAPSRLHHCFGGGGVMGDNCSILYCPRL